MPWSERARARSLATARWWSRRSVLARITISTLLVGVLAVSAVSAISLLVLVQASDASTHRVLVDRLATLRTRVSVANGVVRVDEHNDAVFDTTTWVFDARGRIVDGTAVPSEAAGPLETFGRTRIPLEEVVGRYRLRAEPVQNGAAVIVVALDLEPYLSSLREAVAVIAAIGLLSTAALTITAYATTRRVLRPVGQMARTAERWDRGRLAERFELGPPVDELSELAAVLDGLLDRVALAIADEERLSGELAHELRTPLTVIDGEAQLALRDPSSAPARLARIKEASERMSGTMHTLLDASRGVPRTGDAFTDVSAVIAACVDASPRREGVRVLCASHGPGPWTSAPAQVLDRVLAPLLENGVRHAESRVQVSTRSGDRAIDITVSDDGPGVDVDIADSVFVPGVRSPGSPGSGLGLPLAARLAANVGGRVSLVQRRPATFLVEVPTAPGSHARGSRDP